MGWFRRRGRQNRDLITATEIASFAYCPEAWRLEYGLGLPADNLAARDAGTRHHARQAVAEWLAGWSIRLGLALAAAAVLIFILWVLAR